jgi:Lon protease-like protein
MQLEATIPLFPLGLVLFPGTLLPLHIFEERYKLMIGKCLKENQEFGIVYFNSAAIQTVGCTAKILKVLKHYEDGRLDILTRGRQRFSISELFNQQAYLEARVTFFDDEALDDKYLSQDLAERGINFLKQVASGLEAEADDDVAEDMDFKSLSFLLAGSEGFSPEEKQRFLEMTSTSERFAKGVAALEKIIERMKITDEIHKIIGGNGNLGYFRLPPKPD